MEDGRMYDPGECRGGREELLSQVADTNNISNHF